MSDKKMLYEAIEESPIVDFTIIKKGEEDQIWKIHQRGIIRWEDLHILLTGLRAKEEEFQAKKSPTIAEVNERNGITP